MKSCFLLAILLLLAATARAATDALPSPPRLAVRAYVLYDYSSNQVLVASTSAHDHLAPGPLTKLMTAYLAFNAIRQGQFRPTLKIYPSLAAAGTPGDEPSMLLDHSKPATVTDLLHGLIVQSGNDAARALAELVGGGEDAFATSMNTMAQDLGMRDTHFVNATGKADPRQYSSAYDLALLATAIMRDFPRQYALFGERQYIYGDVTLLNGNRLVWNDPNIDGMAAGHTGTQYNAAISSLRDNRRLIAVVLGANSAAARDRACQDLLNFGFSAFDIVALYHSNQPVARLQVWKGVDEEVAVGFPHGLSVTLPRNSAPGFRATMVTQQPIVAPISAGQQLGILKLMLDGKPYAEFPLLALHDVALANVFSRGWDNIRLMFK